MSKSIQRVPRTLKASSVYQHGASGGRTSVIRQEYLVLVATLVIVYNLEVRDLPVPGVVDVLPEPLRGNLITT